MGPTLEMYVEGGFSWCTIFPITGNKNQNGNIMRVEVDIKNQITYGLWKKIMAHGKTSADFGGEDTKNKFKRANGKKSWTMRN